MDYKTAEDISVWNRRRAGILFLAFLAGCALQPKMIAPNYVPPRTIAVLPMANQSTDLRGPEYVRQVLIRNLESRGYIVAPVKETDEILRTKLGITDGGQMGSAVPAKICQALKVDAAVYGELIDFKFLNVGVYQNKLVEARFKLVGKDGQALWEDQRKASRKYIGTSLKEARNALAIGLAEKMVGNILKAPLYEQVQQVVRMAVSTLPKAK